MLSKIGIGLICLVLAAGVIYMVWAAGKSYCGCYPTKNKKDVDTENKKD